MGTIDKPFDGANVYNGVVYTELGEDGDQFLIEGHPDEEAVLNAVNHHLVHEWGGDPVAPRDLRIERKMGTFEAHSEHCFGDVCDACRAEDHDQCVDEITVENLKPDPSCECSADDHEYGCNCDEYAWWFSATHKDYWHLPGLTAVTTVWL